MAGLSKNMRKTQSNDEDSDDEDETTELINQVLHEFSDVRSVVEKLFSFMNHFVFLKDNSSLSIVSKYPDLKDLIMVTMLTSENFKVR